MKNPNIPHISPGHLDSTERVADYLMSHDYRMAYVSLAALMGIFGRYSNYQGDLDDNNPEYIKNLTRFIFGLNEEDNNLSPEYFKMMAGLTETQNISAREIITTGEKQNGKSAEFFSEQLTANCIDAVCTESSVGKFGLGLKTVFGMLARLPFGSQAVIHSHKDLDDYTFSLIQTGKTNTNDKSQLIASLNNLQIQYYLNQVAKYNKSLNIWRDPASNANGTKITLISSDKNGFSQDYLDEFYKGVLYHRFNPNVKIRVIRSGVEEVINEDCVKGDQYPEIRVVIGSNFIQFEDFGSGGNPVQFLMGSSKSDKKTSDPSVQGKIEIHKNETDNIAFTCANTVLSRYVDIQNISQDSLVRGLQIQLTENAVSFSQSRRGWSATEKDAQKGLESTTAQIVQSFEKFIKTTKDDYLKIKVLNTILAWYDSLKGSNAINKNILSDLPSMLRGIIGPVIRDLKEKNKLLIPNTKEFEVVDFPQSVIRVSEHILQKYTPEGFGTKIPNLSNSGIELWTVKMKSRLGQERLDILTGEIKNMEVSPQKIRAAISIRVEKPAQIWIDESVYQKYEELKQSWKEEKDTLKKQKIEEEFWIYKSMLEVAINQEDTYIVDANQEKVKFAGLEDVEAVNTIDTETAEKQKLSFIESSLQNRCMDLWSSRDSIFNPELRNSESLKPMEAEIRFNEAVDLDHSLNKEMVFIEFKDEENDYDCAFNYQKERISFNEILTGKKKKISTKNLDSLSNNIYFLLTELEKLGDLKLYPEFKKQLNKLFDQGNDLSDEENEENLENFYQILLNIKEKDHIRPEFQGPWRVEVNHDSKPPEIMLINALGVTFTLTIEESGARLYVQKYMTRPQILVAHRPEYKRPEYFEIYSEINGSFIDSLNDVDYKLQRLFDGDFINDASTDLMILLGHILNNVKSKDQIRNPINYAINFSKNVERDKVERYFNIKDFDTRLHYKFLFTLENDELSLDITDIANQHNNILQNHKISNNAKNQFFDIFKNLDRGKIANILPDSTLLNGYFSNLLKAAVDFRFGDINQEKFEASLASCFGLLEIDVLHSFSNDQSKELKYIKWENFQNNVLFPNLDEVKDSLEMLYDSAEMRYLIEHKLAEIFIQNENNPEVFKDLKETLSWLETKTINQKTIFEIFDKLSESVSEFNDRNLYDFKITKDFFIIKLLENIHFAKTIPYLIDQNPDLNWETLLPFLISSQSKDFVFDVDFAQNLNQVVNFISSGSKVYRRLSRLILFLAQEDISVESKTKIIKNLKTLIEKYPESVSEFLQEIFSENQEINDSKDLIFKIANLETANASKRSYLELLLCDDLNFLPTKTEKTFILESILSSDIQSAYSLGQMAYILRDKDDGQVEAFLELVKNKQINLDELVEDSKAKKVFDNLDQSVLQSASNQITYAVQALREIFQNFVDASKNSPDKTFSYEAYKTPHGTLIHEFKDLGKGMSLKQIINLFVPYSGAKENSIGEFGWGGSTAIELAGPNSRISILSQEENKPAFRVTFGVGYKNQPVRIMEISKIEDTLDVFPSDHGTLITIEQDPAQSLPELFFAKIDSVLKYYALGTVSANPNINLKIQNKNAFSPEDLNKAIELPDQAKKATVNDKEMSLQLYKTKGSQISISIKNIPICVLDIFDLPPALITEMTKLGGLEINFGSEDQDTKGLVSLDRNQLLYEPEMKHILLKECFRLMAKRYLEEGTAPFGLGNSWIVDASGFDTRLSNQFLSKKTTDFSNFTYQDYLALITNLDFEYYGNAKSLEKYKAELRYEDISQSSIETTQIIKKSGLSNLSRIINDEKRKAATIGFLDMLSDCDDVMLNLPKNKDAYLEMKKIYNQIVTVLGLKNTLSLSFFQAKFEKFENALPAGFLMLDTSIHLNINYFVSLYLRNRKLFLSALVRDVLHEISHYYQDNQDPDVHGKNFKNIMELISSFAVKHTSK